jgi:predicted ATPase/DNA-binding SARP family transcriptional activator
MDGSCRIELFGDIRLIQEDRIVTRFRTRKVAHLLVCLALPPGRSHHREALVDRFWPDLDLDAGRDSLSTALSALRKALEPDVPPGAVLVADRLSVRLNSAAVTTDVLEFEDLLRQAARTLDPTLRSSLLGRAAELYRGDLVPDCYDDWILPEQRRWAERYVDALLAWAQALEEAGALEEALEVAARASAADPLREEACARRLRLYAAQGRFSDARACYREYERKLQQESDAAPSPALHHLIETLRTAPQSVVLTETRPLPDVQPPAGQALSPLRSVVAPRFPPLPSALGRFYGRKQEIEHLMGLLVLETEPQEADHFVASRLITVTGPGGSGKTRLAIEVAGRMATRYEGRVVLVPLDSTDDARRIAGILARTLGLAYSPEADPLESVAAALGPAPCLMILDNYEHLLARPGSGDARAVVRESLDLMPALRCLVTSRQALAIEGEREIRLDPLTTPSGAGIDCESVALFLDRARCIDPGFELTAENAAELAALCDRLEGLPLAIEMAAAWIRVLPAQALRERLDREPTGLAARRKDVPDRHRSLRAALEWSYDLLEPELRRTFAALSVFRGGWSLEAAEAVVGEGALEALADLAERSLVVVEEQGARYRYLETVREYAAERQREREDEEARERHARYYLRQAAEAVSLPRAPQRSAWRNLGRDYPNLNAVLEWLAETRRVEELAQAIATLEGFWFEEGHHLQDGVSWAERALSLYGQRDAIRADALRIAGRLATSQDRYSAARERYEEAMLIARERNDRPGILAAVVGLARVAAELGDAVEAKRLSDEGLAILRTIENPAAVVRGLFDMSGVMHWIGDLEEYERLLREVASLARTTGMRGQLAHALYGIAFLSRDRGDLDKARAFWEECVALDEAEGIRGGGALWGLGMLAEGRGDMAEAARWFERSLRENLDTRNPFGVGEGLQWLAQQALRRDCADRSARLLGAALRQRSQIDTGFRAVLRKDTDALAAELRERLGAERCEALLQEGWHMDPDAAIDYALEGVRSAFAAG